jgi:hypothetical protein
MLPIPFGCLNDVERSAPNFCGAKWRRNGRGATIQPVGLLLLDSYIAARRDRALSVHDELVGAYRSDLLFSKQVSS